MADEVQGITLTLTEEDIRSACGQCGVPFAGLVAIWRRFRTQDKTIQMADILYVMALAKSKNLNPIDNNYALIPRGGDKGFSLTFTKDAALQVILNHPRAKAGTFKRWFVNGKGERLEWDKSPSWKSLPEVDWALEAHCVVMDVDGTPLEGVAKYRNVFSIGQDGNPKFLWMKDAGGMTMKQAYKDLANTQFSGSLPDDEEPNGTLELPARQVPAKSLSAPTVDVRPSVAQDVRDRIAEKGVRIGKTAEVTLAGLEAFIESTGGGDAEAFEKGLDEEIKKLEAKAKKAKPAGTSTPVPETKAPPAQEAPKKTPPKPLTIVRGTIDAISERYKTFPKKQDEKERPRQKFQVLLIDGHDYYLWDTKLHKEAHAAMEAQTPVEVGYVISQSKDDPPNEFREVREFQVIEAGLERPAEEPQLDESKPAPEPAQTGEVPEEDYLFEF